MMHFLFCISFYLLFLISPCKATSNDEKNDKILKTPIVDGRTTSWNTFFKDYIKSNRPVIFQKAFRDHVAFRTWSHDYFYYNSDGAFLFFDMVDKTALSIRTLIRNRQHFLRLYFLLPWFLYRDLTLPKCLDCDLLHGKMITPTWIWNFHHWRSKLLDYDTGQVLCMVKKSQDVTLIPDWTSDMVDQDAEDVLMKDGDIEYHKIHLKEGDCLYIPPTFISQFEAKADSMAVMFEFIPSVILKNESEYEFCQSLGENVPLNETFFEKYELHDMDTYWEIISSHLNKNVLCIDEEKVLDIMCSTTKDKKAAKEAVRDLVGEAFDIIDVNGDGNFCWSDIDALTIDTGQSLEKKLSEKVNFIWDIVETFTDDSESKKVPHISDEL